VTGLSFTIDKWILVKPLVAQLATTIADSVIIERAFNEPRQDEWSHSTTIGVG